MRKIMITLICLVMLSGCWSRRELNDLLIVLGYGIDIEDGKYLVSYQVVNPSEISAQKNAGNLSPVTLYQGRGNTLFEAARALTAQVPRKVYLGHLQLFVISEEVARKGISGFVDSFLRDNELRLDFNVVVARGTPASDILKLYTPLEKLPTNSMVNSLETSAKNWAPTISVTMDDVLNKLSSNGVELALTGIRIIGDAEIGSSKINVELIKPPSRYSYTNIAMFKEDKLVGWLSEQESKGYTDITDVLESTSIKIPCGDGKYVGIEVTSSDSKLESTVSNDNPEVTIHIDLQANIVEKQCHDINLTDPSVIAKIQSQADQDVLNNATAAIEKAKRKKSDILGFGRQIEKDHPRYWKKVEKQWSDVYFPQTKVHIDIKLLIRQTGTTGNTTIK